MQNRSIPSNTSHPAPKHSKIVYMPITSDFCHKEADTLARNLLGRQGTEMGGIFEVVV